MLPSEFRGWTIKIAACCPSVLCYTEKLLSGMNGRLTTIKTAGGQELLLAIFIYTPNKENICNVIHGSVFLIVYWTLSYS